MSTIDDIRGLKVKNGLDENLQLFPGQPLAKGLQKNTLMNTA